MFHVILEQIEGCLFASHHFEEFKMKYVDFSSSHPYSLMLSHESTGLELSNDTHFARSTSNSELSTSIRSNLGTADFGPEPQLWRVTSLEPPGLED